MSFKNQIVVITGGAKGIGRGLVESFAKENADVYFLDMDFESGNKLENELNDKGYRVHFRLVDITKEIELAEVIDKIPKIDVLCSNCGIFPQKKIMDMNVEDWEKVQKVNVTSTFLVTKHSIKKMIGAKYGRIILTSSITGPVTGFSGWSHYGASKAALLGFMRSACLEVAKFGITINAVMPGNILTEGLAQQGNDYINSMKKSVPVGFLGDVSDIANGVMFFAKKENRYITGQTLIIDGGQILPESLEALA
ncbi:SDR family oxidoreductase [Cetobacterium somerae]|uniref:SDR family oxidoreductase n=1 Tax=Cetobacterium somerae TaxID=188913 RepID=UPI00224E77D8|nr:SDR family oxidoreductase [Cetobacterium somerae]MCX3067765.1 SDR family oxidoreductase [Cetobacterium somerae]